MKSYQDLNNENVVENLFTEYQKAFVKKVAPKKSESNSGQMSIFDYFANDDEKETNSYAGYRDWYISKYNLPGYTIETGKGQNPLPITQFEQIYKDNIGILILAATKYQNYVD